MNLDHFFARLEAEFIQAAFNNDSHIGWVAYKYSTYRPICNQRRADKRLFCMRLSFLKDKKECIKLIGKVN